MTESSTNAASADGRTLEEVEGRPWGDPPDDTTYLIARCYALRQVPLGQLETEDLRILLGQSIGVATLVPIALRVLDGDPLAEGDFYPGDLLAAVLKLDAAYWSAHPEDRAELAVIAGRVDPESEELEDTEVPVLVANFLAGRDGGDGKITAG